MESRIEKMKRRKYERKLKRKRSSLLFFMIILLFFSLIIVDESCRRLLMVKGQKIMDYKQMEDIHNIHLFGKNYYINQKDIAAKVGTIKNRVEDIISSLTE